MNTVRRNLPALALGMLLGVSLTLLIFSKREPGAVVDADKAAEPLYWVAPMDPAYRRDGPGKSPMGMDLVPVYAEERTGAQPGAVRISPDVEHNLGVRTAVVERGRLPARIDTVGYLQYDEDRLVHVHPRVEGWIETLHLKAGGDPVAAGEPLYALYSPTLVNAQEELLVALKRDNPALVSAALERLRALQVPEAELRRLRETGQVGRAITVYAAQDGVADNLHVREGMYVSPGMELMTIGALDELWVIGEVFERQAALVREGDPVVMQIDYLPGREWRGEVDYVYPTLSERTRTARVRVRIANPDLTLRPGMFAQLRITGAPAAEALLLPREALIRTGAQSRVVLALGEGRFKSVVVRTGRVGSERAEVLEGLREGDRVVTSAQFLIDSESSKRLDLQRMDHSAHDAVDHSGHEGMDQSAHDAMDHSGHEDMDHSGHDGMDHSTHEGMDHGDHEGLDHSTHEDMNHSAHEAMNHGHHEGMQHD